MKVKILLYLILTNGLMFSQTDNKTKPLSQFGLGLIGGININTTIGTTFSVEARTNINSNIYVKFSVGTSPLFKEIGENVKTWEFLNIGDFKQYRTLSYDIDKLKYSIIPVFLGIEYLFNNADVSPYCLVEIGYNFYDQGLEIINTKNGVGGSFATLDELPLEYLENVPLFIEEESLRVGVGGGANIKLNTSFFIDLRYTYLYNSNLINTNQLLLGIKLVFK